MDPPVLFRNEYMFMAWCRAHIHCDQCGGLGAKPTLDKQFICVQCARLLYAPP